MIFKEMNNHYIEGTFIEIASIEIEFTFHSVGLWSLKF